MALYAKPPMSYNELKKLAKKPPCASSCGTAFRIAIVGDSATQFLAAALKGYAASVGLCIEVLDTDYHQIDAQLLDESSETYAFKPDMLLLYMSSEWLWQRFASGSMQNSSFAQSQCDDILTCWQRFHAMMPHAHIMQTNFVQIPDAVFGNASAKINESFVYQLRELNVALQRAAAKAQEVSILDLDMLQSIYGRVNTVDSKMVMVAKAMLSLDILPTVAKQIVDVVKALKGQIKKCIILDLDNTLWGGVIGDDGMEGIELGELGGGAAFLYLQLWLKELKERGIILAVCSKNNEATAKEPFLKHPDMILKLEDISVFVANWQDKASNIRSIQQTLNIGMDSIVFIDDNAFERNAVRAQLADITVPELPEDPADYATYLQSLNLFEAMGFSAEDKQRTKQYQLEAERAASKSAFANYDEYLQSLDMAAACGPFDTFRTPRIAQLTQRSNQFNLRTVRYTQDDVTRLAHENGVYTEWFELSDKYGDHGLISVVVLRKMDADTLFVDTLLMSCRVLKRGMEHFVFNKIAEICRKNGFKRVVGEYIPTAKNGMVSELYTQMGYAAMGSNRFLMEADTYIDHKIYIREGE